MRQGSYMKSIQTGFPRLYLGKVGKVRPFAALLIFPHQAWFQNASILSVDQWFNAYRVVNNGNFRISYRNGWSKPEFSLFIEPMIIRFPILFFPL